MSKAVYDEIRKLGPREASIQAILVAYKAAVGSNWNRPIDVKNVKLIYDTVVGDKKMDPLEADALDLIIEKALFGSGAKVELKRLVESKSAQNAFIAGSTVPWKAYELDRIIGALDSGIVGRIHFRNPRVPRMFYTPRHYQVIQKLLAEKRIKVRKTAATFLGPRLALYASSQNQLVLSTLLQGDFLDANVVYHATIAIQDWYDLVTVNKFSIADAHIAEAVARNEMGVEQLDGALGKALVAAVKVVLENGSPALDIANNRWFNAYNEVVKAIESDALTRTTANGLTDFVEDPTNHTEPGEFLKELVNMKP